MEMCKMLIVYKDIQQDSIQEQVIIMSDAGDGLEEVKRRFAEIS